MDKPQALKLIWDFYGVNAKQTAAHHARHLLEYAQAQKLTYQLADSVSINAQSAMAFLVVTPDEMPLVRDALKPHRGQIHNFV